MEKEKDISKIEKREKMDVISYQDLALVNNHIFLGEISEKFFNFLKKIVETKPKFQDLDIESARKILERIKELVEVLSKIKKFPICGSVGEDIRNRFSLILEEYKNYRKR